MFLLELLFFLLGFLVLPTAYAWLVLLAFRRRRIFGIGMAIFYFAAYVGFSLKGKYIGENRGGSDNARIWCPHWLAVPYSAPSGRQRTELTPKGMLYWPCIALDRGFWHRDADPYAPDPAYLADKMPYQPPPSGLEVSGGNLIFPDSRYSSRFNAGRVITTPTSSCSHTFTLWNVGDHPLTIRAIGPEFGEDTIGISSHKWTPITIAPGKSHDIQVALNMQKLPEGRFFKVLDIYTEGRHTAASELAICGENDLGISVTPSNIGISNFEAGHIVVTPPTVTVNVDRKRLGNRPMPRLQASHSTLRVTELPSDPISPVSPQIMRTYQIAIVPKEYFGIWDERIDMKDPRTHQVYTSVIISGAIKGPLTPYPPMIDFSGYESIKHAVKDTILSGPAINDTLHVASDNKYITASILADPASPSTRRLRVVLSPHTPTGEYHAHITIETSAKQRMMLPVSANAMQPR